MDIIDVMLAKALSPHGQIDTYAAKAAKAKSDADEAVATVESAASTIEETQSAAEELLATAQEALETAQSAQINTLDIEDVDAEVKKMTVNTNTINGQNAYTLQVITTYPDNDLNTQNITKLYKETGNNEDGGMTQKAITDALAAKADSSALSAKADKTYVDEQIAAIDLSGATTSTVNLGSTNDGKVVVIDQNGNIVSGIVTEEDIIEALVLAGGYTAQNALGLEVNYTGKSFTRTQQAYGRNAGTDFNSFIMYGGRTRCNVANDGTITAFYGDNDYAEDGSNGQVMVYQPKFYYQRIPITTNSNKIGKIVTRDSIMISNTSQNGFKVHPLFIDDNGEELDYVLFSAYEGGLYDVSENSYPSVTPTNVDFNNDKLSSVSGTKPITGTSGLSLQKAEQLNILSQDVYIMTNQMIEIIEFGTLNGQASLGKGVCNLSSSGTYNAAALTGSTSSLGNTSGAASSTTIEANGSTTTETEDGKVSIAYRGVENPWGNVWQMLDGVLIYGTTNSNGGVPYICKDKNYSYATLTNNYESAEFSLPNINGWISGLGYGNKKYDWVLMPAECSSSANSALPVGDNGWFTTNLTGLRMIVQGGGWSFEESDGLFYYGCDKAPTDSTYKSYGARLLYIPTKNSTYTSNVAKWQQKMNIGG